MREKMWDIMDEYIYVAGTVEIFEREVIDALVKLFKAEAEKYPISFKYNWETYSVPRGSEANGMCVFSWTFANGNPYHEVFFYK